MLESCRIRLIVPINHVLKGVEMHYLGLIVIAVIIYTILKNAESEGK